MNQYRFDASTEQSYAYHMHIFRRLSHALVPVRNQDGYTVLELIVVLLVMVILVAILVWMRQSM